MTRQVLICAALLLLGQLLAVACAVGVAALTKRRSRLAGLPLAGAGLAMVLAGVSGPGGLPWIGALLCASFAALGALAGLLAGLALRWIGRRKER